MTKHPAEFSINVGTGPKPRFVDTCRGMARSSVGPAGPDGKWECPICGKRVGAIKAGFLKMHRARKQASP